MKLKILIFAIVLFSCHYSFGQNSSYISVSAGIGVPMGNYAKNTMNLTGQNPFENQGFAKTGFDLIMDGSIYLSPNIGFTGAVHFGQNGFDEDPINNLYQGLLVNEPDVRITFKADPYTYFTFLAGPTFGFSQDKISVDLRMMLGIAGTSYPNKILSGTDSSDPDDIETLNVKWNASGGAALALALGGSIRYRITDHIALQLRPEMMWWNLSFDETLTVEESSSSFSSKQTARATSAIPFSIFTIGAGVAYQFNK